MTARRAYRELSNEARIHLSKTGKTLLARFWDSLKRAGFNGGRITVRQARARLPNWKDGTVRKALKGGSAFVLDQQRLIAQQGLTQFFQVPKPLNTPKAMVAKSAPILPRRHGKVAGNGPRGQSLSQPVHNPEVSPKTKRGRAGGEYFVPPTWLIDSLFADKPHYCVFEDIALVCNGNYNAAVSNIPFIGAVRKRSTVKKEAERLDVSRSTLWRRHRIAGVRHSPWKKDVKLTAKQVAALPKNQAELRWRIKKGLQLSRWVHDGKGNYRPATLEGIAGTYASKAHYRRTGRYENAPPLTGPIYMTITMGTEFTDDGRYVHPLGTTMDESK